MLYTSWREASAHLVNPITIGVYPSSKWRRR